MSKKSVYGKTHSLTAKQRDLFEHEPEIQCETEDMKQRREEANEARDRLKKDADEFILRVAAKFAFPFDFFRMDEKTRHA